MNPTKSRRQPRTFTLTRAVLTLALVENTKLPKTGGKKVFFEEEISVIYL